MGLNEMFGLFLFGIFILAFLYILLGNAMFGGDTEITRADIKLLNRRIINSILSFIKAVYNMKTKKE